MTSLADSVVDADRSAHILTHIQNNSFSTLFEESPPKRVTATARRALSEDRNRKPFLQKDALITGRSTGLLEYFKRRRISFSSWRHQQMCEIGPMHAGTVGDRLQFTGDEVSGGDGGYNGYKAERQSALAPPARFPCDQGRDFFEVK